MHKALVVGIDYYEHIPQLYGCVKDSYDVKTVLDRHSDGTRNFTVEHLTGTGPSDRVTRPTLKDKVEALFAGDEEIALFYFAGHGNIQATGGYLLASESKRGDDGVAIADVLRHANESKVRNKIVVLDSCYSGVAGDSTSAAGYAEISEGITILTASTKNQYAGEDHSGGVFTNLFVDALSGGAANLVGDVTPGSVYAHIDQSLGPWDQRPVFKTNVKSFVSLRKVQPPITLADLHRLTEFFPSAGSEFDLDPTFEPERGLSDPAIPAPVAANTEKFAVLQKLNRVNLVVPVDAPHMWHAAMESKACKLTVLGEHYRRLAELNRI